ncbi:MAG TPA: type II secretion system protein [Candidatus Dormibacteraeota bacterium]|nr:type II secretion system protein [Candidatus Dormibacteraeota bacterium]
MKAFGAHGDTIVEVLIVLSILGFAISISYASASRSLADAQQSEQNSYATELARSQIEEILAMVNGGTEDAAGNLSGLSNVHPQNGTQFCMTNGAAVPASAVSCQYPATGVPYTWTDTLTQVATGNPSFPYPYTNNFQVQVVWPDALGQGQDTVTLSYRAYPPP